MDFQENCRQHVTNRAAHLPQIRNKTKRHALQYHNLYSHSRRRLWLQEDYGDTLQYEKMYRFKGESLDMEIETTYQDAIERDDVEVSELLDENMKLPSKGMQVHSEYTLYGHFFFLKQLFSGVEKVKFFLD